MASVDLPLSSFMPPRLERPPLIRDTKPSTVEPDNPPAYAEWGGDPQIKVIGGQGTQSPYGIIYAGDGDPDPGADEVEQPPPGGALVFREIDAALYATEVGKDDCKIKVEGYEALALSVPPELGLPVGSVFVFQFKKH